MTPTCTGSDARAIIEGLKHQLRTRGITYARLADALGVSLPTIKRQLSRGSVSVERLAAICAIADTDLYELAREARTQSGRTPFLTLEQEGALAASESLMLVFHLLLVGWDVDAICHDYQFHPAAMRSVLARLEAARLLVVGRDGRPRLLVPRNVAWREQGPVIGRYGEAARQEFLRARFNGPDELLAMETRELSTASLVLLRRKFEQLRREFIELAELDASITDVEARRNVGMVMALRPWIFSMARVRKRPSAAGRAATRA